MSDLSANDVIRRLMVEHAHPELKMPRFTPSNWWEADLLVVSKAGYIREYEVKFSRSDFFADAKKAQDVRKTGRWEDDPERPGRTRWVCDQENKHELLARSERGPTTFYFVCPAGMIERTELPSWAGLVEFKEVEGERRPMSIRLNWLVDAPRRHKVKADDGLIRSLIAAGYHRWHAGAKP